jgi:hypothetical protein
VLIPALRAAQVTRTPRKVTEMQENATSVLDAVRAEAHEYGNGEDRPVGRHAAVLAAYAVLVTAATGLASATGRRPPPVIRPWDVVLLAAGTHKLSRTISKDAVTAPLRAPFTHYVEPGGPAEVQEEARPQRGLRHSIGELLTCPFCLDVWVATALSIGIVFAPRGTKLVTGVLTALAGADFLQLAYAKAQQSAG